MLSDLKVIITNIHIIINFKNKNIMGNSKVSIDFSTSKYTDNGLANKSNTIADKMDGNPNFTSPVPPIKDLRDATTAYIASISKVEFGSKEDTVVKNNLRATLTVILKNLAAYVQTTSGGEEVIILSSGFDVNKKPSAVGELDKPDNLTVKPGTNKGSIIVNCDVVEYANFYEFEYREVTAAVDSVWVQKTSTKRKLQIDGLTSGKQYTFRVAGAGSYPTRVWSEEIKSFVL